MPPTMPADTLERVQAVPGVDEAVGSVSSENAVLLDKKGEPITSNGPPTIVVSAGPERFDPLTYVEGHKAETAGRGRDRQGDRRQVRLRGRRQGHRRRQRPEEGLHGRRHRHGRRLREPGRLAADPDDARRGPARHRPRRLRRHLGRRAERHVAGGAQGRDRRRAAPERRSRSAPARSRPTSSASDLSEALGFIRIALLVFAGDRAARRRLPDLQHVRGHRRPAHRRSSRCCARSAPRAGRCCARCWRRRSRSACSPRSSGSPSAWRPRRACARCCRAFGLELGGTSLPLEPRTIIAGFAVGIIATVVSGFVPARRATRVQPIEAMRDAVLPTGTHLRRRRIVVAIARRARRRRPAQLRPVRRPPRGGVPSRPRWASAP